MSLKQQIFPLLPVYAIKRATTILPLMRTDRIIPLYRNDKGMLTFDLLYKKGYWELNSKNMKKFKNIKYIKKHKHKNPDSLTKFYDAMEDILIEELKRTSSVSANDAKAKYREDNIKEIKKIYNETKMDSHDEIKKDSHDEIDKKDSYDEINKKKIRKLFDEIGKDRIDKIESFDAKTISKFKIKRLIHRINEKCPRCNS